MKTENNSVSYFNMDSSDYSKELDELFPDYSKELDELLKL